MPTNLPVVPNAFIGRESDVEELLQLLSAVRIVTLCGTGGIGKTRLCLSVARDAVEVFTDGVWLVELAELDSGDLLAERVAAVLGVQVPPGGEPTEAVADAVGGGGQLLVLDNCEHLVDDCARLCGALLAACPELRILTTSREPLRVAGETVWRVPPLSLAPAEGGSDAVRLFVDRAAASGDRTLTGRHDAAVHSLCAELEGIPLAIELAAAMTRVLSVEQIRARLSDRFRLLTSGSRSAPPRQRTLLATVEWSYRMLSTPAQLLLRRLTVFLGGWTLDLAELCCSGDGLPPEAVLTTLSELVDKSLVLADGEAGGEIRYRMLDTVREYARQSLDDGDHEVLKRRHLESMSLMARRMGELIATFDRSQWPEITRMALVLDVMQPNLYAALRYAVRVGEIEQGLRICVDLQWVIVASGRFDPAAGHLDALLRASGPAAPVGLVAHAMGIRALACFFGGDLAGVEHHAREAIRLGRAGGHLAGQSMGTALACAVGVEEDGLTLDLAAELAERAGDVYLRALTVYIKAVLTQAAGRLREAARLYEELVDVHRDCNDWGMALGVIGLAQLAYARRDLEAAARHYQYAQELLHPLDHRGERISCLVGLGRISIELGDFDGARARLAESLALSSGLGQRAAAVELVDAFAELAQREGDHARAVRLAAAASALRERMGGGFLLGAGARAQEVLAPARRELSEPVAARLWAEGRSMPWHQAIEYAVGEPSPDPLPSAPVAVPHSTLTEREREIALLIARGLSNRALADELVISPATVARHVSNILAKLGFSSRTQIATWALDQRQPG
ncbi:LuxR C-terminal-related transcriptional regulator [Nonomuraea longicatena]|uniref:HTH luxR-type domain-containing protein n=1 Tax=Nonomuraea longicatena TaxID=83682 RepID=A0ABN1P436_9ACTN